jgi:hypothetical protein
LAKAATRTPPKRTRRVTAPFDARLEVRLYSTELAKLRDEAKDRGLSASDLVRFQLGDLIAAEPPKAQEPADEPSGPPVDLAGAIEESGLMSRGMAVLRIHSGRVTVGDLQWGMSEIPADLLPRVRVDGQPLELS